MSAIDPDSFGLELGRRELGALALLFLVAFAGFLGLFNRFPVLQDADSYFQLAVARSYAENGVRGGLEWARFSILRERFGDKDFLYHLFLIPFATWMEPLAGGRVALALLNAALATVLAWSALRVAGAWALAVPLWVYVSAFPLFFRLQRLRPEAFALLILLAAASAAARGRYRLLGFLGLVYTLSYTAWHALIGLCVLWFAAEWWRTRRWTPALLLYPALGVGLGLILHPQFPANLNVWVHTNIFLPLYGAGLDVGEEYASISARGLLLDHLGWSFGLLLIWRSSEEFKDRGTGVRKAVVFVLAALSFGGLYLLWGRFVTFFVPFATFALFAELERRGRRLGSWTPLPGRGRLPFALAFLVAVLLGLPSTVSTLGRILRPVSGPVSLETDRRAFGASVPEGAKVAATWGAAEWYTFFAPQGRYLNVLDPIFMAKPYPQEHRLQVAIFRNQEPDVPLLVKTRLDSDFIAIDRFNEPDELTNRLLVDPRMRLRYGGYHLLTEILPDENRRFILDWLVLGPQASLPAAALASGRPYPRLKEEAGGRYEGYVDGRRLGESRKCIGFTHGIALTIATDTCWEFAPAGRSRLWLDGELRLDALEGVGAALGSGFLLEETLAAGNHLITVESCQTERSQLGFYLLERARSPEQEVSDQEAEVATGSPCADVLGRSAVAPKKSRASSHIPVGVGRDRGLEGQYGPPGADHWPPRTGLLPSSRNRPIWTPRGSPHWRSQALFLN